MSKEQIINDLPGDFVRKMRNWVRSRSGNGYVMTSAYEGGTASSGYAETIIPVLVGEASDVDSGLRVVPLSERAAVTLFWEREGNSLRWMGRCLGINEKTVEVRVRHGHALLRMALTSIGLHLDGIAAENAEKAGLFTNRDRTGAIARRRTL